MLENGRELCSCKWKKCARHGNCKACMEHHAKHLKYPLPYCKRKKTGKDKLQDEKTL